MTSLCPGKHQAQREADPVLCHDCQTWIAGDLAWIERTYPTLTDHLMPGQSGDTHHGVPGSRPPLRVDVLTMCAQGGIGGVLGSWVQLICEKREVDPPNYRLSVTAHTVALIRFLRRHHEWLMGQDFADEYGDEIRSLKYNLALLLGDTERTWQPVIGRPTCPVMLDDGESCGGRLKEKIGERFIVCDNDAAHQWEGYAEYERLGLMLGVDPMIGLEMAAALAHVTKRTVQRWIAMGLIETITDGEGRTKLDKRDLEKIVLRVAN